jgi:chromosome segregation ATPase
LYVGHPFLFVTASPFFARRRQYRQFGHSIDSLKIDIEGKDASLVKVHFEHHRLEKEKDTLKSELTRIQKQVQSCEQILAAQEVEITKLNAIVFEADAEKVRQAKEYENVVSERNLLVSQLVKRDTELTSIYERLRVQKSMLANGAASYARYAAEREDLAARLAALKGELLVAKTQVGDTKALEAEAKRLEEDLVAEKTKIRALTEELERPINIHRWRILADRQPEKWQTIQRIQALQKRVLDTKEELKQKEAKIAEQEKEYARLKEVLARQPGPEVADTVAAYQATLKGKAKQLQALESELASYRGRVDEYRRELQRINESMDALADDYIRGMKAQRKAARQADAAAAMAANMRASALDEASLLDVSKELLAAGLTSGSRMGTRQGVVTTAGGTSTGPIGPHQLIPEAVTAVKDEADELLAAYADVLGSGGGSMAGNGGGS